MQNLVQIRSRRVSLLPLIIAVVALADRASASAGTAAPQPRNCEADIPSDQFNDRLDCKTENVNAALFQYVDAAIQLDLVGRITGHNPIFTDSQIQSLRAGRDRAQSTKNRVHDAQRFRDSVKKQQPVEENCYIKEIIGDMNRPHGGNDVQPCEAGEDCEEVIGDGIGDDDGVCEMHGQNREVCAQVCQQPLQSDPDNLDPAIAQETEQNLDEDERVINDATAEINKSAEKMLAAYALRPAWLVSSDCEQYVYDQFPGAPALQVAQVAKNTLDAAFNACSVVGGETIAGFNTEGVCIAAAIVAGIADAISDGFGVAADKHDGEQADRLTRCTTKLHADIQSISASVDGNQASLDEVKTQLADVSSRLDRVTSQLDALSVTMMLRFDRTDTFLCTPQGQRSCFPTGGNGTPKK